MNAKTVSCWVIEEQSYAGSKIGGVAYLNEKVASLAAARHTQNHRDVSHVVLPKQVRLLNDEEGVIGDRVFLINREEPTDVLRRSGLAKLTHEERQALNLNPDGTTAITPPIPKATKSSTP